MRLRHKNLSR